MGWQGLKAVKVSSRLEFSRGDINEKGASGNILKQVGAIELSHCYVHGRIAQRIIAACEELHSYAATHIIYAGRVVPIAIIINEDNVANRQAGGLGRGRKGQQQQGCYTGKSGQPASPKRSKWANREGGERARHTILILSKL